MGGGREEVIDLDKEETPPPSESEVDRAIARLRFETDGGWLDDTCVYKCARNISGGPDVKIELFDTNFVKILQDPKKGYGSLLGWTKTFDLFDLDVLLIPVHRQCHWLAMAVFPTQRRIALYDSLAHPGHMSSVDVRLIQDVFQYLAFEYHEKRGELFDSTGWRACCTWSSGPRQPNFHDCGVYCLMALEIFATWTTGLPDPNDPLVMTSDSKTKRQEMIAILQRSKTE